MNKYCSLIGRVLLNAVQDLTFLEMPVKAIKCSIQDCFPRQRALNIPIGVHALLFAVYYAYHIYKKCDIFAKLDSILQIKNKNFSSHME